MPGRIRRLATTGRLAVAFLLALVVAELVLRVAGLPRKHDFWGSCDHEMGQPDDRLGWVWRGPFVHTVSQGGRLVDFAFDEHHDRVGAAGDVESPDRPTVLLVGESIMAGHGLAWDESVAGRLAAALDVQVVTLGVDGYGSDQAFVRLVDALPRFSRVVAIVTIYFPGLVERAGWRDRPRLAFDGDRPVVSPPHPGFWRDLRVVRVVTDLTGYRDDAAVALTGAIFRQTARLARERGARAVFLAPDLGRQRPRSDADLVDTLLVRQGLEVVDPDWRYATLPGDNHPDAASTRALADALVATLRPR